VAHGSYHNSQLTSPPPPAVTCGLQGGASTSYSTSRQPQWYAATAEAQLGPGRQDTFCLVGDLAAGEEFMRGPLLPLVQLRDKLVEDKILPQGSKKLNQLLDDTSLCPADKRHKLLVTDKSLLTQLKVCG